MAVRARRPAPRLRSWSETPRSSQRNPRSCPPPCRFWAVLLACDQRRDSRGLTCPETRGRSSFYATLLPRGEERMERKRMKSKSLFTLAAVVAVTGAGLALSAGGQAKKDAAPATRTIVHYGDLKWTPILKGADLAVVSGDPSSPAGLYFFRSPSPTCTTIPPP